MLIVASVALVASAAFWSPLLFGGSLHGYDWASHHWNYFDWVRASLVEYRTLPLFMNDAWITKNFLANAESPALGPLVWLLFFLSTDAYLKLLVVVFGAAGLAGAFLLLRDLGTSRGVAATGAAIFCWNGFFASHISVGHHWAMGALLLPGLLLLFRRAAQGSGGALVAAALVNAFTIGGGQHQPFIWQNLWLGLFACLWAIQLRDLAPLRTLALVALLTLGFGAVKLLPMLGEFASYDPSARTVGLPLALLLPSLLAAGQHPELIAPGLDFEHGGAWWEYAFFVGPVALAWLLAGAFFARRCWPLAAVGGLFLLLAIRWPAGLAWLDLWSPLSELPVWRTQRSPSRFLVLALFAATLVSAVGIERLWRESLLRAPRATSGLSALLVALVGASLFAASLPWQRAAPGPALSSRDHRPHPLRVESGRSEATLVDFAPNRLVYRVEAAESARIVFPFRLGEGTSEWRVAGLPEGGLLGSTPRGKLAIDVPPGEFDLVMVYRPQHFYAGAAISAITFLVVGLVSWRTATSRS